MKAEQENKDFEDEEGSAVVEFRAESHCGVDDEVPHGNEWREIV